MKKILLSITLFSLFALVGCKENEVALQKNSFTDIMFQIKQPLFDTSSAEALEVLEGYPIAFQDLSQGAAQHEWLITSENKFISQYETGDSIFTQYIISDDTISTRQKAHVLFPTEGSYKVRLLNKFDRPTDYPISDTIASVYDPELDLYVFDTTFTVSVVSRLNCGIAAYKVTNGVKEEEPVFTFANDEAMPNEADWAVCEVAEGQEIEFSAIDVKGRPSKYAWKLASAKEYVASSSAPVASYQTATTEPFAAGTVTLTAPEGTSSLSKQKPLVKTIPLKISVVSPEIDCIFKGVPVITTIVSEKEDNGKTKISLTTSSRLAEAPVADDLTVTIDGVPMTSDQFVASASGYNINITLNDVKLYSDNEVYVSFTNNNGYTDSYGNKVLNYVPTLASYTYTVISENPTIGGFENSGKGWFFKYGTDGTYTSGLMSDGANARDGSGYFMFDPRAGAKSTSYASLNPTKDITDLDNLLFKEASYYPEIAAPIRIGFYAKVVDCDGISSNGIPAVLLVQGTNEGEKFNLFENGRPTSGTTNLEGISLKAAYDAKDALLEKDRWVYFVSSPLYLCEGVKIDRTFSVKLQYNAYAVVPKTITSQDGTILSYKNDCFIYIDDFEVLDAGIAPAIQ